MKAQPPGIPHQIPDYSKPHFFTFSSATYFTHISKIKHTYFTPFNKTVQLGATKKIGKIKAYLIDRPVK